MADVVRIAMWSGPRNISTAMMRSWGSRADASVCDEPFYAHYLRETGLEHPGAAEVIASHECDPDRVVAWITGPPPGGAALWYQKHMTHHMLPSVRRDWFGAMRHAFLIRDPRAMLVSLLKKYARAELSDTGLPQQVAIFEQIARSSGEPPPVVDADDVLRDPPGMLAALCAALGVSFDPAMLSWAPGLRSTDGVWAKHWYENVAKTRTFDAPRERVEELPESAADVYAECDRLYRRLAAQRLRPAAS